jgi:2-hydroxycyclohexanecarboxyl-CoA dehydrogenase
MGLLTGKVAIISGAGTGLGKGTAVAMAREGACVTLLGRRLEKVQEVARDIEAIGGRALALHCDIRDRAQVDAAVAETVRQFGTVDILVNNATAGLAEFHMVPIDQVSVEDMEAHYRTDVLGYLYCMQACFPYMKEHGGKVINIGSDASTSGMPASGSYPIMKEAVRGLTKAAAMDWARYQIAVNCICPAGRSEGYNEWIRTLPPGGEQAVVAGIPMGRMGDPEQDVGRAVVAFASDLTSFITGRTIHVDGGLGTFR